jgi:hypothetical protein
LDGATYDQTASDNRLILGDYTSGTFGNNFDVIIDHVRYDLSGAYLPTGADADADGMPDSWEYQYFGDITGGVANEDDDGDRKSNVEEYISNTHPKEAASVLKADRIETLGGESVGVSLVTSAQRSYALWKSMGLGATNLWAVVDGPTLGTDGSLMLQDTNAMGSQAFYRVSVMLP